VNKKKRFIWTVQIEVDESWVADGFNLDNERAHEMAMSELPWANDNEVKVRVTKSPKASDIKKAQGY